ncbi:MAG: XdhC family protein [Acidobacteria bacterium]|nr:XdhC family protein [Acidobacteriota bacterium]
MSGDPNLDIFRRIVDLKESGQAGVLATVIQAEGSTPARPGIKMLVHADGRRWGTVGGGAIEQMALQEIREILANRASILRKYSLGEESPADDARPTGMWCGGSAAIFFEYIPPALPAVLFGGGHVGRALVTHLRNSDWHLTVVDTRPEIARGVEGADRVLTVNHAEFLTAENVPPGSFVVIATHSHQLDLQIAETLLAAGLEPAYIGMIASRRKARTILDHLLAKFPGHAMLERLYTPIGLDIGGPAPDEIAVSIVAEMQALRYGKRGNRHLRFAASANSSPTEAS